MSHCVVLYTSELKKGGKKGKVCIPASGLPGENLSWFMQREETRSISNPPGWDTSPSLGCLPALRSPVPIYTHG